MGGVQEERRSRGEKDDWRRGKERKRERRKREWRRKRK
jgi:hypothetical protein